MEVIVGPLEQFLLCVAILSTSITIYKFCRIPGKKWYEIHWGSCVVLCLLFLVFFRFLNFPIWNSVLVIGEFIAVATHSRHPITLLIDWNKVALFLVAAFALMIVMQLPLSGIFPSNEYKTTTIKGVTQDDATATVIQLNKTATVIASSATATAQTSARATASSPTKTIQINPLAASNPDPYPPYNQKLVLFDPLTSNQSGYQWQETDGVAGSCQFTGSAYHIIAAQNYGNRCTAQATNFSDFTYEIQMTFLQGDYQNYQSFGGILFRGGAIGSGGYEFHVYVDGRLYCNAVGGYPLGPIDAVASAFHTGLGQTNLLAVVAKGDSFSLYVNGQPVMGGPLTEFNNGYGHNGMIGVVASESSDVAFHNAKVWQ